MIVELKLFRLTLIWPWYENTILKSEPQAELPPAVEGKVCQSVRLSDPSCSSSSRMASEPRRAVLTRSYYPYEFRVHMKTYRSVTMCVVDASVVCSSADPQATLLQQNPAVSLWNGGLPSLHTSQ